MPRCWTNGNSIAGTLAEAYLSRRGITLPVAPDVARFHPEGRHPHGHVGPVLVTPIRDLDANVIGDQRTWLQLQLDHLDGKPQGPARRTSHGNLTGGGIWLGEPGERIVLGEGLETVLSVMQAVDLPGIAAVSTAGLKAIRLPATVHEVVLAADHDPGGLAAAKVKAEELAAEGRTVRLAVPPVAGDDFNDVLRRNGAEGARAIVEAAGAYVPTGEVRQRRGVDALGPMPEAFRRAFDPKITEELSAGVDLPRPPTIPELHELVSTIVRGPFTYKGRRLDPATVYDDWTELAFAVIGWAEAWHDQHGHLPRLMLRIWKAAEDATFITADPRGGYGGVDSVKFDELRRSHRPDGSGIGTLIGWASEARLAHTTKDERQYGARRLKVLAKGLSAGTVSPADAAYRAGRLAAAMKVDPPLAALGLVFGKAAIGTEIHTQFEAGRRRPASLRLPSPTNN
ncbi:MAG: toprim domain-containing protein [Geminicoccaceae bacterium]